MNTDSARSCDESLNGSRVLAALLFSITLLGSAASSLATLHYVDLNGTNATPPYTNWATAAKNIQDAVDVSVVSDEVVVTNGTYATGRRVLDGATNRVLIAKTLVVRSVNGPQFTAIDGANLVRCVYLTNGASLTGFTLTNGSSADETGGASGGTLNNCILVSNSYYAASSCVLNHCTLTSNNGGASSSTLNNCTLTTNFFGAESCTLNNCTLAGNNEGAGSSVLKNCALTGNTSYGAEGCTLTNCTVSGNLAIGAYNCTLYNSIVYFNAGQNYDSTCTLNYCCATPQSTNGIGNISLDPQLASLSHISANSPCKGAGKSAYSGGTDIDGETWLNPPSIGCDEYHAGAVTGLLSAAITASFTNVTAGFALQLAGLMEGKVAYSVWDFGDGVTVTNEPFTTHAWATVGNYPVVLRAYNESLPAGISATLVVHVLQAPIHYVVAGSANPVAPYTSWATAATNIQDAVDAATVPGALVLVTNGTYSSVYVQADKFLSFQSVNGPQFTTINGGGSSGCAFFYNATTLSGFTLTNGHAYVGGGVYSESTATVVSNCVLSGNSAWSAGGVAYCTLNNCTLSGNSAYSADYTGGNGGGAYYCTLNHCTLSANSAYIYYFPGGNGGGAYYCTLNDCTLNGNSAQYGGGASECMLNNCAFTNNLAHYDGGGASFCTLANCTLAGNLTPDLQGEGGGAYFCTLSNCALTGNSATYGGGSDQSTLTNCAFANNSARYGGGGAYYCTLANCTLTRNSAQYDGGGAYSGTLANCALTGNSALGHGGGVYQGALANCTLMGNSAGYGGGAYSSTLSSCALGQNSATNSGGGAYYGTLNNCTLTGNSALNSGGGASGGTLNNCIVYFNTAPQGANYDSPWTLNYCCTTPAPNYGVSNIVSDPQLASLSHLSAGSPCRAAGSAASTVGTDIDGEAWLNPPSIGCDEYHAGAVTRALSVSITASYTTVTPGVRVQFTALVDGPTTGSVWDFGDGITVTNQPYASHAWNALGDYTVTLRAFNESQPGGVTATVIVHVVVPPVHYVAAGSASPVAPFSSWATAARTIQDAVDAATVPGALVLVTNGTYSTGGRAVYGAMTNRVALTKPVTLRSVNGPQFTIIQGRPVPGTNNGDGAIRCVYLTNGASLFGFTLTHGATRAVYDYPTLLRECSGGGLWCESTNGTVVSNCVVSGNSAYYYGGGAYAGTLNNCLLSTNSITVAGGGAYGCTLNNCSLIGNLATNYGSGGGAQSCALNGCVMTGNSAYNGAGAIWSDLNNCTLTGNSALMSVGGAESCTLNNCIVYFNTALFLANYDPACTLQYCCTTPQPTNGVGNISVDPQLATFSHLGATSPCRGAGGAAYAGGTDIDGEGWLNPPSIGCDEYHAGAVTGPLNAAIVASFTNVSVGFSVQFTGSIDGKPVASIWDFGDGIMTTNEPYTAHAWAAPGDYVVVLRVLNESQPGGVSASLTVHVVNEIHYVEADSASPLAPYTSWTTAARNIQDAVDAAVAPGALVLVTNGIYANGGRVAHGTMTNRVAVMKQLILRSVNGPEFTIIQGHQVPGTTNGDGAIRCVYLTNGASLFGFTLTNGATRAVYEEGDGGGLWCESTNGVLVTNCVLAGNSAYYSGGGAYGGTLNNCILSDNSATYYSYGGGAYGSALKNCVLSGCQAVVGGGAANSTLDNCALTGNSAVNTGGAACNCVLNNCALSGNSAGSGGGASDSTLDNCALTGNSAPGGAGGGAYFGTLSHCTLSGNSAGQGGGVYYSTIYNSALTGNTALEGGGADYGMLTNCTLTGNSASSGGGVAHSTVNNSIVYFNTAAAGANYDTNSTLNFSCTTPPPNNSMGNLSLDPQLASFSHLSVGSPCRGAGDPAYASGTDIDGETWLNPPSIGCDEYHVGALTGPLSVGILASFTNVGSGFAVQLTALTEGRTTESFWEFGDGLIELNQPYASHAWTAPGDYVVVLWAFNESYPAGVSASVTVHVADYVHYVAADSTNPVVPYSSWATAATNIQDAVDAAAEPGALVLVTNGTYATGARTVVGDSTTNRVAAANPLTLRSVNGPLFTAIIGGPSVRCVALTNGASLSGFTLTGGAGGVTGGTVSNCTLTGNSGYASSYSTLNNCTLSSNSGPGAGYSTLNNCTLNANLGYAADHSTLNNCLVTANGAGAYSSTLSNCTVAGNSGDGADYSTLNNCTLANNSGYGAVNSTLNNCAVSANFGYGAVGCSLTNCTLTGNSTRFGVGATASFLNNCIIYFNGGANYDAYCTLNYCCTTPQPTNGAGNISLDPQLASLSHLLAGSPCHGAGNAAWVTGTDIDGEAWLNPPSIGCDEYYAGSLTGPLSVTIGASRTNVLVGYAVQLTALIDGRLTASSWDFGDGTTATNQPIASHAWAALGDYAVVLRAYNQSYPAGISTTTIVHVVTGVHYVAADNTNPVAPYTSWATAANSLQAAINTAEPGASVVVVSNGFYGPIYVPALMAVRSVNGAQFTTISGGGGSRCATLATNASLSGFTLANGHVQGSGGGASGGTLNNCTLTGNVAEAPLNQHYVCVYYDPVYHFCRGSEIVYSVGDAYGGGAAYCTLNNCTLAGNSVQAPLDYNYDYYSLTYSVGNAFGGGAAYCTLNNCTVTGNQAQTSLSYVYYGSLDSNGGYGRQAGGGGVYDCTLTNCALRNNRVEGFMGYLEDPYYRFGYGYEIDVPGLGGGALDSTLNNCTLTGNSASDSGGGAYGCTLASCALNANAGSGAADSRLNNCTLTGNGLAASDCTLSNCIAYFNTWANYDSSCSLNYCCTTPQPTKGVGNIASDPQLASASHLSLLSPCIGRGSQNAASGVDIDGEPWANPPSIGCDEYRADSVSGPLGLAITQSETKVATNIPVQFTGWIEGRIIASSWNFADGVTVNNQPYIAHAWSIPGDYAVVLRAYNESNPGGISATAMVHVVTGLHYVAADSSNPVSPYDSWATAATNLQDAITAAFEPGAQVLVANGIYAPIALHSSLQVRSVNGPLVTIINGVRSNLCVSLADGTSLTGFTLTSGSSGATGGTLNNCILTGNSGLGASHCTLNNCALSANLGGGASGCTLNHCTLTGNPASETEPFGPPGLPTGGGASSSTLNNCIVYFNQGQNYDSSCILNYCCSTPLPTNGVGNISSDPQLAGACHLSSLSPCIGKGNSAAVSGSDIDGEPWASPPSIGCDEYHAGGATGPLNVGITVPFTNVAVGYPAGFTALIDGRTDFSVWDFGDGALEPNQPYASHAYAAPGDYTVSLWAFSDSYPDGLSTSVTIHVVTGFHYVAANSASSVAPYISWATAATNLQDAINTVEPGGSVIVTNGTYAPIQASGPLTVRSVNGAQFTTIDGGHSNSCVTLGLSTSLSGFTLTNGGTRYGYGAAFGGTLSNCILSGNSAFQGGGAAYGTLNNCTLNSNSAHQGGGAYHCTLSNCSLSGNSAAGGYGEGQGGGAAYSSLNNCTLTGNLGRYGGGTFESTMSNCTLAGNVVGATTDGGFGGGAYGGTLNKCMLKGNSAVEGGGAIYSILNNCTLTGNTAPGSNAGGGGAGGCTLNNCTLVGNSSAYGGGASGSTLNNCIVLDVTAGCTQNYCWSTDPLFATNLRLQSNSPCINAGNNALAVGSTDLDGNPRIAGGTVDIGAYEFQTPVSAISYAWLQQYGLPTDGSADSSDPDGDGVDNYHEWLAGTDPTNALSSPAQLTITPSGVPPRGIILLWSTNAVGFTLQSTTNPLSLASWVTNSPAPIVIAGQNTVTNPITAVRQFYRLIH